jgi:sortase A
MIRKAGFALMAIGLGLVAWIGVTLLWGEPFTSLYTRHQQHELSRQLAALDRQWSAKVAPLAAARTVRARPLAEVMRDRAREFSRALRDGHAVGQIIVPRLGLHMVVVEGTSESDLAKGPGHYNAASGEKTSLPGMGGVVAIAGHRTTYRRPFRHIDNLQPGDDIYLRMPYGVFTYRVYMHRVVASNDWSILRHRAFEKLVLSACHPLYSASHRWVVFARLRSERDIRDE